MGNIAVKKNTAATPLPEKPGVTYDDAELMSQVEVVANAFARAYNRKHGTKIPVPVTVKFDLHTRKPKYAGLACWRGQDNMWIEINMIMLRDYPREILNVTTPHEMAHLAEMYEDWRFNRKSTGDHGTTWCQMMASMAQPIRKYHGMNTAKAVAAYKQHKKAKKSVAKNIAKVLGV